jgi:CxxC-x17-CxxC domain-containing protein
MTVGDKTLVCRDCGHSFIFTAGEQAFYLERGFVEPARCPGCRAARRAARPQSEVAGGGGSTAPRAERRLFPAICAECGRETMVPFEPRNGRPVYCRDCYQRIRVG